MILANEMNTVIEYSHTNILVCLCGCQGNAVVSSALSSIKLVLYNTNDTNNTCGYFCYFHSLYSLWEYLSTCQLKTVKQALFLASIQQEPSDLMRGDWSRL